MDAFLRRNYDLPVAWRLAEGLSNAMLLGHLWAGGGLCSPLAVVYAVHWAASVNYHLRPCVWHFEVDCVMIGVVAVERLYLIFPSRLLWAAGCLCLFVGDESHSYACFARVALAVALALYSSWDRVAAWWVVSFLLGACCYVVADWCLWASMLYGKALAHVGFHAYMTGAAYLEVGMRFPCAKRLDGVRLVVYTGVVARRLLRSG